MLSNLYPFLDPNNYTFDSDKIEVVDGVAKLKYIEVPDCTFGANYNIGIDGTRGNGDLTGTAYGGASVSGGKLDLAHNDVRYIDYDANLNANNQQIGCFRFKVIPNYNGANATEQVFFCNTKAPGVGENLIYIRHRAGTVDGHYLVLHMYDYQRNLIKEAVLCFWKAVQGREYEFEIDYDFTNGATRFFMNGVQQGPTITETAVRDSNIGLLRIGSNYKAQNTSNFKIDDFQVFSKVQHTSNYVPSSVIINPYSIDNPIIKPNSVISVEGLEQFYASITEGTVKFTIEVDGIQKYWDGASWVSSSGYNQSNSATTILDNLSSLDLSLGKSIRPISYLHSDGISPTSLSSIILGYNFYGQSSLNPKTCIVYGYVRDSKNIGLSDVEVIATPQDDREFKTNEFVYFPKAVNTITDANGYFELELIRSSAFDSNVDYVIEFKREGKVNSKKYTDITVPDKETENFWNLI